MASRRRSLERRRRKLEDEISRRRSLLETHKRNLYDFEEIIAKKGGELHATLAEQRSRDEARRNVEETEEEIRRLEAELAASPVPAPPLPSRQALPFALILAVGFVLCLLCRQHWHRFVPLGTQTDANTNPCARAHHSSSNLYAFAFPHFLACYSTFSYLHTYPYPLLRRNRRGRF